MVLPLYNSPFTHVPRTNVLYCLLTQAEPSLMASRPISRTRTVVLYRLLPQAVRSIPSIPNSGSPRCRALLPATAGGTFVNGL